MEKRKQYLVKNLPLMSLRDWLNELIALDEGKKFTVGNVQGYIRRGKIPKKFGNGGMLIERAKFDDQRVKLYNVFVYQMNQNDENKCEVCDNK